MLQRQTATNLCRSEDTSVCAETPYNIRVCAFATSTLLAVSERLLLSCGSHAAQHGDYK